jgi:hypothetical protein
MKKILSLTRTQKVNLFANEKNTLTNESMMMVRGGVDDGGLIRK